MFSIRFDYYLDFVAQSVLHEAVLDVPGDGVLEEFNLSDALLEDLPVVLRVVC